MSCISKDLIQAIQEENSEFIRETFSKNPSLLQDQPNSHEFTKSLLLELLHCRNEEIIELVIIFVKLRGNIDLQNFIVKWSRSSGGIYESNYLDVSINLGNIKLTEFLLKNGVRYVFHWDENTAREIIFLSKRNTRKEMLKLLIQHGFDTGIRFRTGANIINMFLNYYVKKSDNDATEIAEILMNSGVSIDEGEGQVMGYTPIHNSVGVQNIQLVSFFLANGVDVNRRTLWGETPIWLASKKDDNIEIINMLLLNGADINAQNNDGHAALHVACNFKNWRTISFLINQGAHISILDNYGLTPFDLLKCHVTSNSLNDDWCILVIVKEFSKLVFENLPVSQKDIDSIQNFPKARYHFEKCISELQLMKESKFYFPYSYYFVFKASNNDVKKLTNLSKNEDFVKEFMTNLNKFVYFGFDLFIILNRIVLIRDKLNERDSRLKSVFENFLPEVVINIVANNLTLEDLPLS